MIGVVIPAYKRKECLRKTLQSLVLQTKKNFYVVVVDDHSPEPLEDVIKEFKWKLHLKYIYAETNGGPGAARQIGLNYCYQQGFEFVVFLDSDDLLFPHAIARMEQEIHFTQADIVSFAFWKEDKRKKGKKVSAENKTFVHGKIYRTDYLQTNNITFPNLRTNEDLAFNLKAIELSNNVSYQDEVLHLFCADMNSITRCGDHRAELELDYVEAIYDAAHFLKQKNKITDIIIMSIFDCYNSFQRGVCFGGAVSQKQKEHLSWLLRVEEFQDKLAEAGWLKGAAEILLQGVYFDGRFISFPQNFNDWLGEYTNADSNN